MPSLVLAAKSTADPSNRTPSAERLVNCYAYPAPEGAKAPLIIRNTPGLRDFTTIPGPFLRAVARVEGEIYAVANGVLWKIKETGTATYLAAIPDDVNTTIAGHRQNVTISADGGYFVWDGAALTEPGDGALPDVSSVAFLSQFTLMTEMDGSRVEWTEVGAPVDRNGLFFATAEARDDKIIRGMSYGAYYMVLKENSVETWGTTGLGGSSAFIRIGGEVLEHGLRAFNLVCWTPDGLFWVGTDNVARLNGQIVSPPNVNVALVEGEPTHCFFYEDRGHALCAIRFGDRPAWVYDATMGYWHERASGPDHKAWDVIASVYCYEQWHLADRLGHIFRLGTAPYDADKPMRRTIISRNLFIENKSFTVSLLELEGLFGKYEIEEVAPNWLTDELGFPLLDEDGRYITAEDQQPVSMMKRPGRIWARFSKDGGNTFGVPKMRDVGRVGKYGAQVKFHAQGQFDDMVVELNQTDPVDVPLLSEAVVEVS